MDKEGDLQLSDASWDLLKLQSDVGAVWLLNT